MIGSRFQRGVLRLLVQAAIVVLPLVALAVLGVLWLAEHGTWLPFAIGVVATTTLLFWTSRWLLPRAAAGSSAAATPGSAEPPLPGSWPEAGRLAWNDVLVRAAEAEHTPPAIDATEAWRDLVVGTIDTVARRFHPDAADPVREATVGQCFEIAERLLHDVRTEWIELLPLVGDLPLRTACKLPEVARRLPLLMQVLGWAARVWRAGRFLVNPAAAVPYEIDIHVHDWPAARLAEETRRLLAAELVRRVGRYAIDAFSGRGLASLDRGAEIEASKPIRALVVGPRNAGKSSLVNALVRLDVARVDVAAGRADPVEAVVAREDLAGIVLVDTAGFGGVDDAAARHRIDEAVGDIDLVLAVTSAVRAARDEERQILAALRRRFEGSSTRAVPPVVVAVTHIDRVRPAADWRPPYDFVTGDSDKERNVRDACDTIAADLGVDPRLVVPVCLAEGLTSNVDDGLVAALVAVLPEAGRARACRWLGRRLGSGRWSRVGARLGRLVDQLTGP